MIFINIFVHIITIKNRFSSFHIYIYIHIHIYVYTHLYMYMGVCMCFDYFNQSVENYNFIVL